MARSPVQSQQVDYLWYVTRSGEEQWPGSQSVGSLGAPTCIWVMYWGFRDVVVHSTQTSGGLNWDRRHLEATDLESGLVRVTNLPENIWAVVLKPDYFPCSFQCEETRQLDMCTVTW